MWEHFGNVDWGLTFAAIVISILPPLIIYFALNKWVTARYDNGATKVDNRIDIRRI